MLKGYRDGVQPLLLLVLIRFCVVRVQRGGLMGVCWEKVGLFSGAKVLSLLMEGIIDDALDAVESIFIVF